MAGFPTVTAERGLISAAAFEPAQKIRVAYDDGKRRGLVRDEILAVRAQSLGRLRGAVQMRDMIASGHLQMESEGERNLDAIWLPHDPRPLPQVWVCTATTALTSPTSMRASISSTTGKRTTRVASTAIATTCGTSPWPSWTSKPCE